ncbi:hypothetical protein [Soonwooa sp.]|uniref:hypothetical protein n=1 Tax=Soonwooa sp. TaxID=1938592 RepID=UPI00260FCFEE|nr:hypothetical protein [Soonwooa sp.]
MKQIALIFTLFTSMAFAQADVEEQQDSSVSLEVARNVMVYDIRGVFQIADKTCAVDQGHTFTSVKYAAGEEQLRTDLKKRINKYLNMDAYAPDGNFYIDLTINRQGEISKIQPGPSIPNTRYFYQDLESAIKKLNTKWIPATCDSNPIESKVRVKLLFDSVSMDVPQ